MCDSPTEANFDSLHTYIFTERKEFREQYDFWKKKIEPVENKKFFRW